MNFKSQETQQKLRGGYYTPATIANFLSQWALVHQPQRILEPSCGDGQFLSAIHRQLNQGHGVAPAFVDAIELFPQEAEKAKIAGERLRQFRTEVEIVNADFFQWIDEVNGTEWEAIVGNPPYIRYQYFEKEQRAKAEKIFAQANVPFTKRTNAWVPFVIASIMHLTPGGRLAMVIPAEILHVQHANGLRLLLEQEMESVTLIHFRQIVFENTLQGVVLLLATKRHRAFKPLKQTKSTRLSIFAEQSEANLHIIDINDENDLPKLQVSHILNGNGSTHPVWQGHWMLALLNESKPSGL